MVNAYLCFANLNIFSTELGTENHSVRVGTDLSSPERGAVEAKSEPLPVAEEGETLR